MNRKPEAPPTDARLSASDSSGFGPPEFDTDIRPAGEHEWTATLSDRWNAFGGVVNGGYLLAVALTALRAEMPFPAPLAASAYFLRPGAPGPARLRTEIARVGRRLATGEARLHQDGGEVLRVLASFVDPGRSRGPTVVGARMPDLPDPELCADLGDLGDATIARRVEYRYPQRPGWVAGEPSGVPRAEFWMAFADGREVDSFGLALLVDAAAPVVLDVGARASATAELTVHLRDRPAPGWLACRASTRFLIDGYHEEDFEIWDRTGRFVAQGRQLARVSG